MTMPNRRPSLLILALCALLTACTASKRTEIVEEDTDGSFEPDQLKTYRWDFSAMGKNAPEGGHLPEFNRVVCEHVDKHLSEKGYQRVDQGPADFIMDYRVTITQEEAAMAPANRGENDQKANEYGLRWTFDSNETPTFRGMQAPKDEIMVYQQGTLHLGATNNNKQAIWHYTANRILSGRGNEAERRAAIRIAVDKLMAEFPDRTTP